MLSPQEAADALATRRTLYYASHHADTANHQAPADFRANLQRAMADAAALIVLWRGAQTG
jgi:hypothetical protein